MSFNFNKNKKDKLLSNDGFFNIKGEKINYNSDIGINTFTFQSNSIDYSEGIKKEKTVHQINSIDSYNKMRTSNVLDLNNINQQIPNNTQSSLLNYSIKEIGFSTYKNSKPSDYIGLDSHMAVNLEVLNNLYTSRIKSLNNSIKNIPDIIMQDELFKQFKSNQETESFLKERILEIISSTFAQNKEEEISKLQREVITLYSIINYLCGEDKFYNNNSENLYTLNNNSEKKDNCNNRLDKYSDSNYFAIDNNLKSRNFSSEKNPEAYYKCSNEELKSLSLNDLIFNPPILNTKFIKVLDNFSKLDRDNKELLKLIEK